MKFTKMHGAGNDYIYVDCFREKIENPAFVAQKVSDRHKGIGGDGLVLIMPSERADVRMRMFNADGSEAEMCGNASRCVGKFFYEKGYTDKNIITLETKAGIKILELFPENGKVNQVKVNMGEPILEPVRIPVKSSKERVINESMDFEGNTFSVTCVSMGNPHAVLFVDDVNGFDIEGIGRKIENAPVFPERTNVEFVEIISPKLAKMRVWERGSGETQACGTGACATLVAAFLTGKLERKATISLLGGDLEIEWKEKDNHVYMTGPAETVFEGEINLNG